MQTPNLLEVKNLSVDFPIRSGVMGRVIGHVHAVRDVSFTLQRGTTLGLVGESGCGKTTLGRTILRLYKATAGEIFFEQTNILSLSSKELRLQRRDFQMIFQDPNESLNSRHTVRQIIEEPLIVHRFGNARVRLQWVTELLVKVGLSPDALNRFPHEFSGGQRQRIGIARAIALKPKLVICDEPVSALDVSIQSQILNLLLSLQEEFELTFMFVAHNLAVVKHISDQIAVMYLGKIVELTDAKTIYENALHPYTQALLSAIPKPDPKMRSQKHKPLQGEMPSAVHPPSGCSFHTRCPFAQDVCRTTPPPLQEHQSDHKVACHFAGELQF